MTPIRVESINIRNSISSNGPVQLESSYTATNIDIKTQVIKKYSFQALDEKESIATHLKLDSFIFF